MAKDDYDVIIFKILVYLYALLKGKEIFDQDKYNKAISRKSINEEYLIRIYKMMSDDGLIEELHFKKAWGQDLIPLFDEKDMIITSKGVHYLQENSKMKEVKDFILDKTTDVIANLVIATGLNIICR